MYDHNGNIRDKREILRIKLKSLAAEARIIRLEENKLKAQARWAKPERAFNPWHHQELYRHRVENVRRAARNTNIAYGLIRGKTYFQLEPKCHVPPNWTEVERMVKQYGPSDFDWNGVIAGRPAPTLAPAAAAAEVPAAA